MGSSPAGSPAWSISLELRINTGSDAIEERSMFNNVARGTFDFASRLEAKWTQVQSGAVMFIKVCVCVYVWVCVGVCVCVCARARSQR